MPKQHVMDIDIMYEAYGKGDTVVYLQSPFGGINPGAYYIAGRLSKSNRVIIWDSPNCGQSGVLIKDSQSEWHLACEYLEGLLQVLKEGQVHLVGCSGGGEMALLFAHLYPHRVKSIAMYRPTDTTSDIEQCIIKARYFNLAGIAKEYSMSRMLEYSQNPPNDRWGHISEWIAELYCKDSEKFLEMDNNAFAHILQKWGEWMNNPFFYRANLSDDELKQIDIPVLIAACDDKHHPETLAVDLHNQLCKSTYLPSKKSRQEDEIYNAQYEEHPFGGFVDFVDAYEHFLSDLVVSNSIKTNRLSRSFFMADALTLAKELLGKIIVHETADGPIRAVITETEAYMGAMDKGSHAYKNRRTDRTETMFHIGGTSYVYLIYGMYYCMNVVANAADIPEAVLIRKVEPADNESRQRMHARRRVKKEKNLSDGPGKLCIAMDITKEENDLDMVTSEKFYLTEGIEVDSKEIKCGKRINIDYAEEAADFLWRFYI